MSLRHFSATGIAKPQLECKSRLTFAISAQLFPASLMVLSLCSSAGVQGVLVRLFLAGGGPIGEDVMPDSSPPMDEDAAPVGSCSCGAGCDVPDIDANEESDADRRLLLRVAGEGVCVVAEVSAAVAVSYVSGTSGAGSSSCCLSTRLLDIGHKVKSDAQVLKIVCCT